MLAFGIFFVVNVRPHFLLLWYYCSLPHLNSLMLCLEQYPLAVSGCDSTIGFPTDGSCQCQPLFYHCELAWLAWITQNPFSSWFFLYSEGSPLPVDFEIWNVLTSRTCVLWAAAPRLRLQHAALAKPSSGLSCCYQEGSVLLLLAPFFWQFAVSLILLAHLKVKQ